MENLRESTRETLYEKNGRNYSFYNIHKLGESGYPVDSLPFSIKILLESLLRNCNGKEILRDDVLALAGWKPSMDSFPDIPFLPARVVLQDFTGVPCVVDLASMRDAMKTLGGDPKKINPQIPVSLVIDHSVQIDFFASKDALEKNMELEFSRNRERYEFIKWGQNSFRNFEVFPPGSGIIHQVNLEFIASGVVQKEEKDGILVYPDSLVGTDSHTTMINGLGILGWGVGGIEAEAVMLGQPLSMLAPEVVGFKITGSLPEGSTSTDIALYVTQILRAKNVVGKFVEFYGEGLSSMSLADRATIANMAPEYGATMGFFPMDAESLRYLKNTGRSDELIELVEAYMKALGIFREDSTPEPLFSDKIELNLGDIRPSVAGPKRPQDRIYLKEMKNAFSAALVNPTEKRGYGLTPEEYQRSTLYKEDNHTPMTHGAVVIASITSCTNTSNPSVVIAAALLAKKAVEKGLTIPPYVKTSFAPGSRVVEHYLTHSGLLEYLEKLGFHIVGYGCATCIGNSGPLPDPVAQTITEADLVVASVLSGNRNFEGRINPHVKANFLASPPLVVAFAIAGTVAINMETEPLGYGADGESVFLRDIWPSKNEINQIKTLAENPEVFRSIYGNVLHQSRMWQDIPVTRSEFYSWDDNATYIRNPPFFKDISPETKPIGGIKNARVLLKLGDSVTTDHISPAGSFKPDTPAGRYLLEKGIHPSDYNSYGSRRGNDRVMTRGTFANIRIKNELAPGTEGGFTTFLPDGANHNKVMSVYDAAMKYRDANIPTLVIAGKDYGMGSSRDWAAKGTMLLGVKAVIAESFERIHRSNLVGMGVLPLEFTDGQNRETLGITGRETFQIPLDDSLRHGQKIQITTIREDGTQNEFSVLVRIDTPVEMEYYRNGGILQTVLRRIALEK